MRKGHLVCFVEQGLTLLGKAGFVTVEKGTLRTIFYLKTVGFL